MSYSPNTTPQKVDILPSKTNSQCAIAPLYQKTINYYNENAAEFCANTINADMSSHYRLFLEELNARFSKYNSAKKIRLLDFGCGSGRDSLYFKNLGLAVTPLDGSVAMANATHELTNLNVICTDFLTYQPIPQSFEAIWACASLLHLEYDALIRVLKNLLTALVFNGVLYLSFKYGQGTNERNGRLFTNLDENGLTQILNVIKTESNHTLIFVPQIICSWQTGDVRESHKGEIWLNAILTTYPKVS